MPHVIDEMLEVIRSHLGMDVAFVSRFEGGRRVFRHVSPIDATAPRVGDSHELEATYCTRIVDGTLDTLLTDAAADPRVRDMPVTQALGIRAYAGVPIAMGDGS